MDAPNVLNPANPNAQDQFVDVVQGPAVQNQLQGPTVQNQVQGPTVQNQAQGPTVQNPAQGPTNQNQAQVPTGQIPAQGPAAQIPVQGPTQVGQNIPIQPPPQLAPVQPAPAGFVVPTPQIIYQNWIGKKPEFSGKPEEDAESHLLSTRDWMEAQNFPEGDKVRCCCLTLIGEARLWYESLAPLDDDWPPLQNKFRWQYLKIGNTPKQLFHAWRTFKFDENTDKIDSYVLRMSQVAAMAKLWRDADIREFQEHPSVSTLLNSDQCKQSLRCHRFSKESFNQGKIGQTIDWTVLHSIHESY